MVRTSPGTPLPIGYIEKQVGWVDDHAPEYEQKIIQAAREAILRENPGYQPYRAPDHPEIRIERVLDGAGVPHYTAYMGFAPVHTAAEPLNNRNLNDAPLTRGDDREAAVWPPMGYYEQKFGR